MPLQYPWGYCQVVDHPRGIQLERQYEINAKKQQIIVRFVKLNHSK